MSQVTVFPKAPVKKNEAPDPPKYPDIRIGDKVRVRFRDRKKSDQYVEAGPPERTGVVVFVSEHWVTVDVGPYRVCAWKSDIAALYRDGAAIVIRPELEAWGRKREVAQ